MTTQHLQRRSELVTPFLLGAGPQSLGRSGSSMQSKSSLKTLEGSKSTDPNTKIEEAQWKAKTSERHLIREKGSLHKGLRELHHSTNTFNKEKEDEAKEQFNELAMKISILSKLHHGSYQLSKLNTLDRITQNRRTRKHQKEEDRRFQITVTTTEQQYDSILRTMEQVVAEARELGSKFERQLREKARQHHELGLQLREVGAQLRLERAKREKFYKEEERRRREEAVEKLGHWKDAQSMSTTLQTQLRNYEKEYLNKSRDQGKEVRGVQERRALQVREYARKIQGVEVKLRRVAEEQRNLAQNKAHLTSQQVVAGAESRVEEHLSRAREHVEQRQIKANKWKPKLQQLARENEERLEKMERTLLYEDVVKAGERESALFRKMRQLESDTRKQEQVVGSKRNVMEQEGQRGRKQAQDQLRQINGTQNQLAEEVSKEEAALRQLIVQRDNAVTEYRQHQAALKDTITVFRTMTCKNTAQQPDQ